MPINPNADFNQLIIWLNDNLMDEKSIVPHSDDIPRIPSKGIYFWFMHPDGYKALSNFVVIEPITARYTKEINGVKYDLVYLGTTGTGKQGNSNLTKRLEWHIDQKHLEKTICQKESALSTLRTGLGGLLADDLIIPNTESLINTFMKKYTVVFWIEYPDNKLLIDSDEDKLIKLIRPLLNLKNNPNALQNAYINPTKIYKARRSIVERKTKSRQGFKNINLNKLNTEKIMDKINEHTFELNGKQYHLTFNGAAIIKTNGTSQMVLPILREYIDKDKLPIELNNSNGNKKNTHTIAKEVIEYFSQKDGKNDFRRIVIQNKKSTIKNSNENHKLSENKSCDDFKQKFDWDKIKDKSKKKLLIIACSDKKISGGDIILQNNYFDNKLLYDNLIKDRISNKENYEQLLINEPKYFISKNNRHIKRENKVVSEIYFSECVVKCLYLPGFERYSGDFYSQEHKRLYLERNKDSNLHILIISGLNGVIEFRDSIIDYHFEMKKAKLWKKKNNNTIKETILKYIDINQISNDLVFYSLSPSSYLDVLKPVNNDWNDLWITGGRLANNKNSANCLKEFLSRL